MLVDSLRERLEELESQRDHARHWANYFMSVGNDHRWPMEPGVGQAAHDYLFPGLGSVYGYTSDGWRPGSEVKGEGNG